MYDFAHPLSDALEGVTHSLCTLEFENNREFYDWILAQVDVPSTPRQIEFARLNLDYAVMSKRRLLELVEEKHVAGWDDPRMPTLAGAEAARLHARGHPQLLPQRRHRQERQHRRDGPARVLHPRRPEPQGAAGAGCRTSPQGGPRQLPGGSRGRAGGALLSPRRAQGRIAPAPLLPRDLHRAGRLPRRAAQGLPPAGAGARGGGSATPTSSVATKWSRTRPPAR